MVARGIGPVATLVGPTVVGALLAAQGAPPELDLLTLEIAAPRHWQDELRPTNLGTLFASQDPRAVWRPFADHLAELQQRLAGADAEAAAARLREYGGGLRARVTGHRGRDETEVPELAIAFDLADDPAVDGAAMRGDVARWLGYLFGDHAASGELPMLGRRLALPRDAAGALAVGAIAAAPAPRGRPPLLRLRLDVPAAVDLLARRDENRAALHALFGSAQRLVVELATAGPQVALSVAIEFGPGPRGLAEGLWPIGRPPVAALPLPPGAAAIATRRVDATALSQCLLAFEAARLDVPVADCERAQNAAAGIDLRRDLYAHLGDEVTLLLCPADPDVNPGLLDGIAIAVRVRDGVAFGKGLRAQRGRNGVVDGDWWLFPLSGDRREAIEALRGALAAPAPSPSARTPPPAGPGPQGRATVAVADLVADRIAAAGMLLRGTFGSGLHVHPRQVRRALADLRPLLERCNLLTATATTEVTATAVRWQLLW
jgi:hypothetical protein